MAYNEGKGMISISDLRNNGWTDKLIETLLGQPDFVLTNAYCATGFEYKFFGGEIAVGSMSGYKLTSYFY